MLLIGFVWLIFVNEFGIIFKLFYKFNFCNWKILGNFKWIIKWSKMFEGIGGEIFC